MSNPSKLFFLNDSGLLVQVNSGNPLPVKLIGSSGATAFINLTDVPSSYTGAALKSVRVNAGATGLEFVTGGGGGTVDSIVAGANVTVDATDPANPIVVAFAGMFDGGFANSIFGGTTAINGGTA